MNKNRVDRHQWLAAVIVLASSLLTGCTADNLRQGLYEGFRTRNDLQQTPPERAGKQETPDYRAYEQLRRGQPAR